MIEYNRQAHTVVGSMCYFNQKYPMICVIK